MNDFSNLLSTDIISSDYDIFWTTSEHVKQLEPRPVLIASNPFKEGSADEMQLKKMLQACQLKDEDYHIIQFEANTQIAWHSLRDHLKIKSILMLGVAPHQLGVSAQFMPHQLSRFNDCNWILTDSLDTLQQRPEIKTHLWNYGLKPAFIDKVYS